MATGDTAPPLAIPPPAIEPLSDDDGSSPLSDLGGSQNDLDQLDQLEQSSQIDRDGDTDEDADDTEAETERLYPTPHNPTRHRDVLDEGDAIERTPTKLRQAVAVDDDEDEPLSELQGSFASSPPGFHSSGPPTAEKLQSPTLDILAEAAATQDPDNRKRKRSSLPSDPAEEEEHSRKRSVSVAASETEDHDGDIPMLDDEEPSTKTNSGDEAVPAPAIDDEHDERGDDADAEAQIEEESRIRKQTRSGSKKRKSPRSGSDEAADGTAAEEEGAHTGDDENIEADVGEELEATAQRNEEELERKKVALDQLTSIEKRFAAFRDRLYEERLEQLNKEEAMLKSDIPTHPEYLAMMECIDARRDDKTRLAHNEYELNMESLARWVVARRAQIHSQYFQDVREARERVMAELGQHWYSIQHERRKHANNVNEFGLRLPQSQTQKVRDAMAYNKEVSILSGIAKYEGMPAAPDMRGASLHELDDDFDAMRRGRGPAQHPQRPVYSDYRGLPFGQGLGAAGEQFLEQTPWANPNHPSNAHLLQQRQPSTQHEPRKRSPLPEASSSRRLSNQPNNYPSSTISNTPNYVSYNGNTAAPKNVPRQATSSPEAVRAASLLEQTSARSMKAAAAAAAASAQAEQGKVKREAALPVGGF